MIDTIRDIAIEIAEGQIIRMMYYHKKNYDKNYMSIKEIRNKLEKDLRVEYQDDQIETLIKNLLKKKVIEKDGIDFGGFFESLKADYGLKKKIFEKLEQNYDIRKIITTSPF